MAGSASSSAFVAVFRSSSGAGAVALVPFAAVFAGVFDCASDAEGITRAASPTNPTSAFFRVMFTTFVADRSCAARAGLTGRPRKYSYRGRLERHKFARKTPWKTDGR